MKFGKYLESRQVELAEYNTHFIDYKALKKLMKQLATVPNNEDVELEDDIAQDIDYSEASVYRRLQDNKASFFFKLERELEKVNLYYVDKESELQMKFNLIVSKINDYKVSGRLASKQSVAYKTITAVIKKFLKDLRNLEYYVELNRTGFSKVLKKWDKRSHSNEKEFYLATVVSVQPIFTRNEVSKISDETLNLMMEVNDITELSTINTSTAVNSGSFIYGSSMVGSYPVSENSTFVQARRSSSAGVIDKGFFTVVGLTAIDLDLEIEYWIQDILNISTLKDETRRIATLANFVPTKVLPRMEELIQSDTNKSITINEAMTKLFSALIDTPIDDNCLATFYESCSKYIDFTYSDEDDELFSKMNLFHIACGCTTASRVFLLKEALKLENISFEIIKNLLNTQDIHGRLPLHYAAEKAKTDFVALMIDYKLIDDINVPDHDRKSVLILALLSNDIKAVEIILKAGATAFPNVSDNLPNPLSIACENGSYDAVSLILHKFGKNIRSDYLNKMEYLHIVAKSTNSKDLVELLISFGADVNHRDKFLNRTPLFYAVIHCHEIVVSELLKNGGSVHIIDDEGNTPLYYSLWESDVSVLNAILGGISMDIKPVKKSKGLVPRTLSPKDFADIDLVSINDLTDSFENIPAFTLPPPIIPLRKYGHNYLENRNYVKVLFKPGAESITIDNDSDSLLHSPGRIMLTSNISDIIPRNVAFPISKSSDDASFDDDLDEHGEIIFQVDSLNNFSIQFEIYPSSGTTLIAKTDTPPSFLKTELLNGKGSLRLPLFDSRLTTIGSICFEFEVILPFTGHSLKFTEFEPYWKSTNGEVDPKGSDPVKIDTGLITESSLSGKYQILKVHFLNDGRLVVAPNMYIDINGAKIFLFDLTTKQVEALTNSTIFLNKQITLEELDSCLLSGVFDLESLLNSIPSTLQINIQVSFPTAEEIICIPVKKSPMINLNSLVDELLSIVFENERQIKASEGFRRSLLFSSCSWEVCAAINWKQPIFPVFLKFDNLIYDANTSKKFEYDTSNHLLEFLLNEVSWSSIKKTINIGGMVKFAIKNHLLGIILPGNLLSISDKVVESVKKKGLFIVSNFTDQNTEFNSGLDVNGLSNGHELIFRNGNDI
ncbi:Phosphate system positive regulatory protein PHO81 [Nakaseomyces bracarensis]|uniref:Phosphate system positive regulatory protein PHO81 n=1 Tax=Nakaseomyces bracarensis TaxID=273131 RepID=A0ABR4NRA8_9SACH